MTSIYRMFNAGGALLYVGQTGNLPTRLDTHRSKKPWWTEVASITVEHFVSRDAALDAERRAILRESPEYNVTPAEHGSRAWASRFANRAKYHDVGRSCDDMGCSPCHGERWSA